MVLPERFDRLVEALRRLPGIGPKSAQRMAMHLLTSDRPAAERLLLALRAALDGIGQCRRCRNLSESEVCALCRQPRRDATTLCVVEQPAHVLAIEQGGGYQGLYFVLMGRLSAIDGIGPEELGLDLLEQRLADDGIAELIVATNATVDGQATAHYLGAMAHAHGVRVSRIACGVPMGGDLDYLDGGTLASALAGRRDF